MPSRGFPIYTSIVPISLLPRIAMRGVSPPLEGNPHFSVSRVEMERSPGISHARYVLEFRKRYGSQARSTGLTGLDAGSLELLTWHEPEGDHPPLSLYRGDAPRI